MDAWAKAHGFRLADGPAPEIQPWGYAVEIDGTLVWTDGLGSTKADAGEPPGRCLRRRRLHCHSREAAVTMDRIASITVSGEFR